MLPRVQWNQLCKNNGVKRRFSASLEGSKLGSYATITHDATGGISPQPCHALEYTYSAITDEHPDMEQSKRLIQKYALTRNFCNSNLFSQGFARFTRRLSSYTSIKIPSFSAPVSPDHNQKKPSVSALYVAHGDTSNVSVVNVDLDLEKELSDLDVLSHNVRSRGLEKVVNIFRLASDYKVLKILASDAENLEEKRGSIAKEMKFLVKNAGGRECQQEKKILSERGRKVREELKDIQLTMWNLESKCMLYGLQLPAALSPSTPEKDFTMEEYGNIPEFNFKPRNHKAIGEKTKTLSFRSTTSRDLLVSRRPVSSGAYYLHGDLARLECHLVDEISNRLRAAGLTQFSSPDMVKTIVMEGCGEEFTDPCKVFTIQNKDSKIMDQESKEGSHSREKLDITLHLCGGSSLPAMAAYLCKMNVSKASLPLEWFSVGRHFSPDVVGEVETLGLLGVPQASRIGILGAADSADGSKSLYCNYRSLLWNIYKDLGLPIRLVQVGIGGLQRSESERVDIEAWLPGMQRSVKVASVGLYSDFIGRRLMMKSSSDLDDIYNNNYLHVVYGTVLDIPRLLAVVMETFQTEWGSFYIPDQVKAFNKKK